MRALGNADKRRETDNSAYHALRVTRAIGCVYCDVPERSSKLRHMHYQLTQISSLRQVTLNLKTCKERKNKCPAQLMLRKTVEKLNSETHAFYYSV